MRVSNLRRLRRLLHLALAPVKLSRIINGARFVERCSSNVRQLIIFSVATFNYLGMSRIVLLLWPYFYT